MRVFLEWRAQRIRPISDKVPENLDDPDCQKSNFWLFWFVAKVRKQDDNNPTLQGPSISFTKENGGETPWCSKIPWLIFSDIHHTCDSVYWELHSQGVGTEKLQLFLGLVSGCFFVWFAVIYKSRMLFWLTVEYYCGIYVYSTRNPVEYGFCTASSLYKPLPFIVRLPMIQRHICIHVITALHDYLLWVKGLSKKCSLWSNTCTLTYTFSFRSQMGSSYQSHDHGSVCMQPSVEAYTVLPNISVHKTGNDTKLPVYACSM